MDVAMRPGIPVLIWILAVTVACGGPSESGPPEVPAGTPAGERVDSASAGTIAGRAVFRGTPPEPQPVDIRTDPKCADEAGSEIRDLSVIVTNGGLENVFVHIKSGLGSYAFDLPTEPVKIDQDGCAYIPRVVGVRVGQPIEVSNSDPLTHNVHAAARVNQPFNKAQPFEGMRQTHTFTKPEIMVPLKCDVHPWMAAYIGVVDHPYFAVTGPGGAFELKDVPPGTYTVEAWHEKLGTRTATVTLSEKDTGRLEFIY
jgi:plastocyanin